MFILDSCNEIVIQKSRFIAHIKQVKDIESFSDFLNLEKKRYYDASHHCYAYIIKSSQKASDDGEPSMSAGIPILGVLKGHELDENACIVTRYFGGIKLGIGGLARAYREATKKAIEIADIYDYQEIGRYKISLDYETSPQFESFLYAQKIEIEDILYEEKGATYLFLDSDDHSKEINNITRGKTIEILSPKVIARKINK